MSPALDRPLGKPLVVNLITPSESQPEPNEAAVPLKPETPPATEDREPRLSPQIQQVPTISRDITPAKDVKSENCIGFASIPVRLAGPLEFHGTYQKRNSINAPLATTEPILVASCTRGCEAFSACGGVSASGLKEGLARSPAFTFSSVSQALGFYTAVPSLFRYLKKAAERTTRHGILTSVTPHIVGTSVHVRFVYTCGDATAGQAMTTWATDAACSALMLERRPPGLIHFMSDGNTSGDKELAWGSLPEPSGVSVIAWGTITHDASETMLGCSTQELKSALSVLEGGGARHGQIGQGVNSTANIVAAMFISCGQDVASVLESGVSHLTGEYDPTTKDLTLSLSFPSLLVRTVESSASHATQREALELVGCAGAGRRWAFAETVAGFALALNLSTLAAFASNTLAAGHKNNNLARGPKAKL
ncbi:uncharacterized protein L3040_001258 [Drepanopeziza brunnea f. sp. 'multigermtubi']|nr:hypothetical protein L3040_001258 [Drepanopeziza brunnea f. sp. 'multigermtubi']